MGQITATTARRMAEALNAYVWVEHELAKLHESDDEATLVHMAGLWWEHGETVREMRAQVGKEHEASDLLARQEEIVAENLAWLREHHPEHPRVKAWVAALPSRETDQPKET